MIPYGRTELIEHQPVFEMCLAYRNAQDEVRKAFELLESAKNRLHLHFGSYADTVLTRNMSSFDIPREATDIETLIRKNAWRSIVDKCQIQNLVSEKRWSEMQREIENGKLPELTAEAVQDIVSGFAGNLNQLIAETVEETFDYLRPPCSEYATNTEYEIGRKVIKECVIDYSKWHTSLSHYHTQYLKSLDNVFHLLDGKGPIKYPGDLVTMIQEAIDNKQWECETEYFHCKWYKKGTIHIELRRQDLVAELNKVAGGNRLRNKARMT